MGNQSGFTKRGGHGQSGRQGGSRDQATGTPARVGVPMFMKRPAPSGEQAPRTAGRFAVGASSSRFEHEADAAASRVLANELADAPPQSSRPAIEPRAGRSSIAEAAGSPGEALDPGTRGYMESRFGVGLGQVRVHTGPAAASLTRGLGARAFTHGSDVFFGEGHRPGRDALTAHELAHVVQQSGGVTDGPSGSIPAYTGAAQVQCSFTASYPEPSGNGVFEVDLQTREGAVDTPPTQSGMDGYIRFVPAAGSPNANVIAFTQIVKLTDAGGADVDPSSMPPAQAPRGALGDPGLRTADNPGTGVEGGYFTDVHHRPNAGSPGVPRGDFLSPRYNFQPAPAGTVGVAGQTQQPAQYGGGTGGVVGQTPGFKRSDDPADIRSAALYDFPGTAGATANLDFRFESVALGEDTMFAYGAVSWGFDLRAGRVQNEYLHVVSGQSVTFDEALERHRDFYVHEPVTFYFDFDSDVLGGGEAAKIDAFLAYLSRNPDVHMSLEGFADQVGGASAYNRNLSLRRARAVETALLARGVPANRIDPAIVSHGASTAATANAGTGDQGGSAALGADQAREENRWANRRVVLGFRHVPAAGP